MPVFRKRMQQQTLRLRKFRQLQAAAGRRAAARIHKAGGQPATLYGAQGVAVPTKQIARMRVNYNSIRGLASQFGSTRLSLLLWGAEKADPALHAHSLPICAWVRAIWTGTIKLEHMQQVPHHVGLKQLSLDALQRGEAIHAPRRVQHASLVRGPQCGAQRPNAANVIRDERPRVVR